MRFDLRSIPSSASARAVLALITSSLVAPIASTLAPVSIASSLAPAATASGPHDLVAVKAGTIHAVPGATVWEGGATLILLDGKIVAAGKDIEVPRAARVVDYGPDAVIVPGLVAADSTYGLQFPSPRTADPAVRAVDSFDPYAEYTFALAEGVTTVYVSPARGRLIAGQGAVVKLARNDAAPDRDRILSASATIHGAVNAEARNTPGYWDPPVPATIDVGMGVERPQLPRSLMGAMVALKELVTLAQTGKDSDEYGPGVAGTLRELMTLRKPWRLSATTEPEIRALLAFARENGLPLILAGANEAGDVASEIAAANVPVIVESEVRPNAPLRDLGKEIDSRWPRYDTAAKLDRAGVRVAIATAPGVSVADLRFAAGVASRGGLDKEHALRAITLAPAEMLGVADRVGSLEPGKDADFVVLNGHPLESTTAVVATWTGGDVAFKGAVQEHSAAIVLEVDELYTGDGEVMSPGQLLMKDGRIVAVGHKVGHPSGATVVRGKAAMPGMIDALGHLGLEGSTKVPATRFEMKRIVEPGDFVDRRVARAGITTVVLSPRSASRTGAPVMAYKPAGREIDKQVVADPAALRLQWTDKNRVESGKTVRELLNKAVEYDKKWRDYEHKRESWTPPKETPASEAADKDKAEKSGGKDEHADEKGGEKNGDKKADEKKEGGEKKDADADKKDEDKKSKKKKGEEEAAHPVTGAWETKVTIPPFPESRLRFYVLETDGKIKGTLRCNAVSDELVEVTGTRTDRKVSLAGEANRGTVQFDGQEEKQMLKGTLTFGVTKVEVELAQTSTEYEIARRPEHRKLVEEKKKEIKGEPKAPTLDLDLEPLRRAIHGQAAVIVGVDRADEVVACVSAFEAAGIEPVLYGANEAWKVADEIRGKVAGVLLSPRVVQTEPKTGIQKRNRYAELADAGIPVAFHSEAEEGAAELPLVAAYAVAQGMSPEAALRALTFQAAQMLRVDKRIGLLESGYDADVLLLDGSPLEATTSVTRVWVNGEEVR